ncbi:MAG: hypothetical protein IJU57_06785 [Clostridia bacterium]|nr:hypothetical protein [Clostridia bacterium]
MKSILLKTVSLILVTAMAVCFAAACSQDQYLPRNMKAAYSDADSFRFYIPEKWTKDEGQDSVGAYYSNKDPSSVSVLAWDLQHTDDTVDTWWEINEQDLKTVFSDYELVSQENTTVDGKYARKYIYTATMGQNKFKFLQVAFVNSAVVYLFTYTSKESTFDSHLDDVNMMLEHWALK